MTGPATAASNSRHHAKPAPNPTEPVVLSSNWAGPVVTGGTYSQVTTTFVVPTAKCSSQSTDSSFWAGIDGSGTSQTVEQAGVRVTCAHRHAQYVPWVEEFPAPESDIDPSLFTVAPGDTVAVTVVAHRSTDTYTLDDVTSGATFTTTAAAPQGATDSSAECIAEAPTGSKGIEKLTDFGTVHFSQCQVRVADPAAAHCQIVNGHGCPADSQITYNNIASNHHHKNRLQAETMSTNGGGFTVTWHHS
jgi:hypothetical protein